MLDLVLDDGYAFVHTLLAVVGLAVRMKRLEHGAKRGYECPYVNPSYIQNQISSKKGEI